MKRELFKLREPFQRLMFHTDEEPDIIYHYCSIPTFISIVNKRELWLTATADMNDFLESQWIEKVLNQFRQHSDNATKHHEILEYFSNKIFPEYFLCCFSAGRDVLSQWRAYADDGKGFAVGVDTSALKRLGRSRIDCLDEGLIEFAPVIYNQTLQAEIIEDIFNKICTYGEKFGIKNIKGIQDQINLILGYLSIIFKNTAFSEEQEWRLAKRDYTSECYPMLIDNYLISARDVRATKNSLSPFHRFQFNEDFIREVVIGPKNSSNRYRVEDFLRDNGFSKVKISNSAASYK